MMAISLIQKYNVPDLDTQAIQRFLIGMKKNFH
jgi:hypothetical protein